MSTYQTFKFDVSLGSENFWDLCEKTQERVGDDGVILGHGHIGDGNLHLNCCLKGWENKDAQKRVKEALEPYVFDYIKDISGSISAEHGIGLLKAPYLDRSKSPELISYMQMMKDIFDPKRILNPYKVLPDYH